MSRYVAPVTEETLKAAFRLPAVAAAGSGFSSTPPCRASPSAPASRWSRTSSICGRSRRAAHDVAGARARHGDAPRRDHRDRSRCVAKTLRRSGARSPVAAFLPGLAVAVVIHAAFNRCCCRRWPAALLTAGPAAGRARGVRAQRARDARVGGRRTGPRPRAARAGRAPRISASTRFGSYLRELRQRFPGPVVADMFCLLRLELELSVQAKALLMAREAGLEVADDDDLRGSARRDRSTSPVDRRDRPAGARSRCR